MTLIVSIRQPAALTEVSLPIRQRSLMFWPAAAAGRFKMVET